MTARVWIDHREAWRIVGDIARKAAPTVDELPTVNPAFADWQHEQRGIERAIVEGRIRPVYPVKP